MTVWAGLTADQIRRGVRPHYRVLIGCYRTWSPDAVTPVLVSFTIGPDGKVQDAHAGGTQGELATCIADAFKTFGFPRPVGGAGVAASYPLSFDRTSGD